MLQSTLNGAPTPAQTTPNSPSAPVSTLSRRVRLLLKSRLLALMTLVPPQLLAPVRLRVKEEGTAVLLRLQPEDWARRGRIPGDHLSPPERLVWDALQNGAKTRKQLARLTNMAEKGKLKYLLPNLVARKVLVHYPLGHGYQRANTLPAKS